MVGNRVNFAYEYELFDAPVPAWMKKVLQPSLECLYFYCDEKLPLASELVYDPEYLSSVNGAVVKPSSQDMAWWGSTHPLARQTNSKIVNHEVNHQLGLWTPQGGIVHSWQDIDELMGEGRWRLKDPWLMGGSGQWRIDRVLLHDPAIRTGIEKRLTKGALLLEQALDIKRVIGTTFNLKEDSYEMLFSVENQLNSQGNFQGGQVVATPQALHHDLNRVVDYWWNQGARGILEIDSFEHSGGWYACAEVNHRRTMGWFIWQLEKRFGPGRLLLEQCEGRRLNPVVAPLPAFWITT